MIQYMFNTNFHSMKVFYALISLCFTVCILFNVSPLNAQSIFTGSADSPELSVLQTNQDGLKLRNTLGVINLGTTTSQGSLFTRLSVNGYVNNQQFGSPEVPVYRKLIELPAGAGVSIRIEGYEVKEYSLDEFGYQQLLYPSQPPRSKSIDEHDLVMNQKAYEQNGYPSSELVTVDELGTMRGSHIARLNISPVQYNPVLNTIRVYENIEFSLHFVNADFGQTMERKKALKSPWFNGLNRHLLNRIQVDERENFTRYPVTYVIVSDRMFESQLEEFIAWKTKKGFTVVEAYTDMPEVGNTTASIKAYLESLYDAGTAENPAPSFVLFVGDIQQVPTWNNGDGVTDRNYVEYTGDLFPEIFYGRFSAQTTAQLQPMIDKTLQYEEYTMPDPSYLDEVVIVAGVDGSHGYNWGNGQVNYGTINYFNNNHGITAHAFLYPASGSQSAQIRQHVSDGVTFSNYSAHCSPDGWADPSFVKSHIPALQNADKYGFMLSNCCSSSEYQLDECFSEAIVRAPGKGTVGHAGGSNSTYWDEDYYFAVGVGAITEVPPAYEETGPGAFDGLFHTHGEVFAEWYTTQSQVIFTGNMAVTEGSPGMAQYYWDIYNLIGDPSLMVYFSEPPVMVVSHPSFLPLGSASIEVSTVPYGYIGFSIEGQLFGSGIADEYGQAFIQLDPITMPGIADLVVTAQNYQPYSGTVIVSAPDGPYVIYHSHAIQDEDGNAQADFGEAVQLDMTMENVGNGLASAVNVTISSDSPFVTITDNVADFGDIDGNETAFVANAFAFEVHNNVPDKHPIRFNLMSESQSKEIWSSYFTIQAHAPNVTLQSFTVADEGGDGNIEPGETAVLSVFVQNTGSSSLYELVSQLSCNNPSMLINTEPLAFELLESGQVLQMDFAVMASPDITDGSTVLFDLQTIGNNDYNAVNNFSLTVGQIPVLVLNLANSPSMEAMQSCFNTLNVGNELVAGMPADLTLYKSVFVCLGIYPDNYVLSTSDGQKLANYLDQGGRVYMEGGDTWAYDNQTPAHSYFKINGLQDGSGDLSSIVGMDGTVAQGMEFDYNGRNSYIDQIAAEVGGKLMFNNSAPSYGVAVSYSNDTYRTIGASFEFAGLQDAGNNTKDELMARMLSFFEVPYYWTGQKELQTSGFGLAVYPNPASTRLNLTLSFDSSVSASIQLFNAMGQQVMEIAQNTSYEQGSHQLGFSIEMLPKGVYFVALESEGRKMMKHFVVVR